MFKELLFMNIFAPSTQKRQQNLTI